MIYYIATYISWFECAQQCGEPNELVCPCHTQWGGACGGARTQAIHFEIIMPTHKSYSSINCAVNRNTFYKNSLNDYFKIKHTYAGKLSTTIRLYHESHHIRQRLLMQFNTNYISKWEQNGDVCIDRVTPGRLFSSAILPARNPMPCSALCSVDRSVGYCSLQSYEKHELNIINK